MAGSYADIMTYTSAQAFEIDNLIWYMVFEILRLDYIYREAMKNNTSEFN